MLPLASSARRCVCLHVYMFICLYVYITEEGRYQISVWRLVICYASDVIKYGRRKSELAV